MLDALRSRLAWRAALRAVRRRRPASSLAPLAERRVLAVLPPNADHAVWDALKQIDVPPRRLRLVALGATSPPDQFAGAVQVLDASTRDWRGLPARAAADAWAFAPDVAVNLARAADPAAVLLVGASPATVRVGGHDPRAEPAYDLLTAELLTADPLATGPTEARPDPAALIRILARIDPPLIPLRELPARGSRAAPPRV